MDQNDATFDTMLARRRVPLRVWLVALLAFLGGLIATAAVYHFWGDRLRPAAADAGTALAPASAARPADPVTRVETLEARENALDDRIRELEARLASIDSDSRLASSFAGRAEGLMIAFAARRALDRGLPLGYVESELRQRFEPAEPTAVAIVVRAAREPVTLEELRIGLEKIAPKLMARDPSTGWWEGLRAEIANLVILRQENSQSPLPADRLIRARRLLDAGQVESALVEVSRMPGAAAAQSWITAAKRYINARRALNAIESAVMQGRATSTPPPIVLPAAPAPAGEAAALPAAAE